jgi:CRP-like cAMP-binding protein
MSKSDFFSFITSLKPIELKAIGELSQVLHLEEGITIYSSGEAGNALYIINRGAVEVVHENPLYAARTPVSYLSRGDMFGEMEVLSDTPRKNAIRTCEPVSIQCFKKKDFAELVRRVPAFFFYLSQQIAGQLTKMSDLAFVQSHCLELSGNLANFDMVTIYQTILNSSQTGLLAVVDESKEPAALLYFESGQAKYASYYHLHGEEAFWQLFLHEKIGGAFSFSLLDTEPDALILGPELHRNPTDLLITALQYRDEFKQLSEQLPDPSAILRREKLNLDWNDPAFEELRFLAESVWQTCYSSSMTLLELWHRLSVCELKLYKTILQLLNTGHFSLLTYENAGVA